MNLSLKTITRIFYDGPYVWELLAAPSGSASKIEELHEGNFLYHIFNPGISVSVSGNNFKITRWGLGNLPTSDNSFVHVFIGKIYRSGSKTIVRGKFRLNLFVFGFSLFWLTIAYLLGRQISGRFHDSVFARRRSLSVLLPHQIWWLRSRVQANILAADAERFGPTAVRNSRLAEPALRGAGTWHQRELLTLQWSVRPALRNPGAQSAWRRRPRRKIRHFRCHAFRGE